MVSPRDGVVRLDASGVLRPVGAAAAKWMRERQGAYRLLPGPANALFLFRAKDDGQAEENAPRMVGRVDAPGALHELIKMIAASDARAELLFVNDAGLSRSLFFEGAHLVGAVSSDPSERIGEVMRREKALTDTQLEAVLQKLSASPGRRFGEIAVDLGFVRRERLFGFTATQIEEIFFGALLAKEGSFYLYGDYDVARIAVHHDLPVHALLARALTRVDELTYFRQRIPSLEHVPVAPQGHPAPPPELAPVFLACDGKRSVGDVVAHVQLGEFEVTRALYRLLENGLIKILGPRPRDLETAVEAFNRTLRVIFQAAKINGSDTQLRAQLAEFAQGAGPYGPLFAGAGPNDDGTFDTSRVGRNAEVIVGADPEAALTDWLHDYASFAFFSVATDLPKPALHLLGRQVRDHLRPITPSTSRAERSSSVPPLPMGPTPHAAAPAAPVAAHPAPAAVAPHGPGVPPPLPPPRPSSRRMPAVKPPLPMAAQAAGPSLDASPPIPAAPVVAPAPVAAPSTTQSIEPQIAAPPHVAPDAAPTQVAPDVAPPRVEAPATPQHFEPLEVATSIPPEPPKRRALGAALLVVGVVAMTAGTAAYLKGQSAPAVRTAAPPATPPVTTAAPASEPAAPTPPTAVASSEAVQPAAAASSAAPIEAAPSSATHDGVEPVPHGHTRVRITGASGNRVFVDGHNVGNTPGPILAPCGPHVVRVGSAGRDQSVILPCEEEMTLSR